MQYAFTLNTFLICITNRALNKVCITAARKALKIYIHIYILKMQML